MTSREEQNALVSLAELLLKDLSKVDEAELIKGIQHAELLYAAAPQWSGRLLAVLYRYGGYSWPEIARITGVPRVTAHRRAEPFM